MGPTCSRLKPVRRCGGSFAARAAGTLAGVALAGVSVALPAAAQATVNKELTSCENQVFSQPFASLGDANYYTLAPGGEFNSASEGWVLSGGAHIVKAARPNGSSGGVLSMPAGSEATSPPICVTLEYAKARVWLRGAESGKPLTVAVSYPETRSAAKPKRVGQLTGQKSSWTLSQPFAVKPELAGSEEGTREVRFILTARSEAQLYGMWVDPRMKR
jgi:hypothetical protein